MERCNDVLELVETTRHFRMLRNAAEVGGAGGRGLDAMVREIHEEFESAMRAFKSKVKVFKQQSLSAYIFRCRLNSYMTHGIHRKSSLWVNN